MQVGARLDQSRRVLQHGSLAHACQQRMPPATSRVFTQAHSFHHFPSGVDVYGTEYAYGGVLRLAAV
eukprot:1159639-Pelagomonas_calceolata.AAC.7